MKMPWKRRRSHDENLEEKEKKQNQHFRSFYAISSILNIANLSRIFSAQFLLSGNNNSLEPLNPNSQNVGKPPNKCQKREHPKTLGLSFIASIPKEVASMGKTELEEDRFEGKSNENVFQKRQFVVIDHESESRVTRRVESNGKKKRSEGIFIISPPSSPPSSSSLRSPNHGSFHPPPSVFMSYCHFCNKTLTLKDNVYLYRGDMAFCSEECRTEEIFVDGLILNKPKQDINFPKQS